MIHVYADVAHGWRWATQGWGTTRNPDTGQRLKRGDPPIDQDTADRWLRHDIETRYAPKVKAMVTIPLSADSFGALVSLGYNIGTGGLKRSTLLKRVNAGRFDEVPSQFLRWQYANGRVFKGLTRRRRAESKQFMEGLEKPVRGQEPSRVPLPTRNPSRGNLRAPEATSWLVRAFLSWFR